MSVHVVVARYNEDLVWTNDITHKVTIYNKGELLDGLIHPIIPLVNKGREGETFLRHIVENYNNLDAVTVFLQGDPFDHLNLLNGWELDMTEFEKKMVCYKLNREIDANSRFEGFYQVRYNVPGNTNNSRTSEYCRFYFGETHRFFTVVPGAQYIVPREVILSRPLAFWQRLHTGIYQDKLDGYAMENLWWLAYKGKMDSSIREHDYEKKKLLARYKFGFYNTPYNYYDSNPTNIKTDSFEFIFYNHLKETFQTIFHIGSLDDSIYRDFIGEVHYFEPVPKLLENLKLSKNNNAKSAYNNFIPIGHSYMNENSISKIELLTIDDSDNIVKILSGFGDYLKRIKVLQFACNSPGVRLIDIANYLKRFGFENFSYLTIDGPTQITNYNISFEQYKIVCINALYNTYAPVVYSMPIEIPKPNPKTTVITHIYNEEYLLPFWLNHHKKLFEHGIIIDYNSTDNSILICKAICPTWEIVTTKNKYFGATEIDKEVMEIEERVNGIKIALNTTEFLFCKRPIKDIFESFPDSDKLSLSIDSITPYSVKENNPNNIDELIGGLLSEHVVYKHDRCPRFIHNYKNGNYLTGRHESMNPSIKTQEMDIVWLGFFPMNDNLLKRKLQIKNNIPESDKQRNFGYQHLFEKEKLLTINYENATSGQPLNEINSGLYNVLRATR